MSDLTYQDVTVKAIVRDRQAIIQRLQSLKATCLGTDHQEDTYFETERGKLKWRRGSIENLITHYERILTNGMERTIVYRYDLDPSEEQIALLHATSRTIGVTRKDRIIYMLPQAKIHLDKSSIEEEFLEIEVRDFSGGMPVENLQATCKHLIQKLGIDSKDLISTGYFRG